MNKSKNGWGLLRWLLLTLGLCKTPLGETGCLGNPYFLFCWVTKHPVFLFHLQHSQLGCLWLPSLTVQHLCDLRDVMPRHWSPGAFPNPAFNVIPHPSMNYRQVFKPILYLQSSSLQSDSRLCPNPYLGKQKISLGVVIILSMCLCPQI